MTPSIIDSTLLTTAGREQLFLDPPAVATGRVELALHDDAILVKDPGPNWGDAAIEQYLADAARGSLPVDFRVPNRTIEIPLMLMTVPGGMTYDEARTALQHKAALIQREGGVLKRVLRDGRVVYADLVDAALHFGGGTLQALHDLDADVVLTLQALPDWYGDEEDLGAFPAGTEPHLIFTVPSVRGDYPARVRIIATDASGQAQAGLLWGLRSRHYSPAATAQLAYQAEALTPLDVAASATVAGSTVIRHASLSTGWTSVLSTQIAGVGQMTHTGSYRVWAKVHTTVAVPPRLRLLWDVGDLVAPVTNPAVAVAGANAFYLVNLGVVRLDAPPVGAHRWQAAIQAAAANAGDNVSIDRLWLFPVDEGYGELSAPVTGSDWSGLTGYSARDEFDQPAGALNGKTLPRGGSWATSGDATDFSVDATAHTARRSQNADAMNVGRFAVAGTTTFTSCVAKADVSVSGVGGDVGGLCGVLARYVDANNFVVGGLVATSIAGVGGLSFTSKLELVLRKVVAGTAVVIASKVLSAVGTITLSLDTAGGWTIQCGTDSMAGQHADLATGGALASGKVGLYDEQRDTVQSPTRSYDNFAVYVPELDAVLHPNRTAELRTDGIYRQSADGGGYGPVSHVIGDLPRLPAAGMEGRMTEVILKPSRGEPGIGADPATDAITAHVYARPSWLFVPDVVPA